MVKRLSDALVLQRAAASVRVHNVSVAGTTPLAALKPQTPIRICLWLTALGALFAALCSSALSWDGSGYLFEALDKQTPLTPHGRLINALLQLPVIVLSHVTSDLSILRLAFDVPYASIPFIALSAAWWIARDAEPRLFVWAALGIGLGLLPGQFELTSEANIALELFWPVLFAALIGVRRSHVPVVLALALAVVLSHPYAIGLFGLAALVTVLAGLRHKVEQRAIGGWALAFVLFGGAGVGIFLQSSYDMQQISSGGLGWSLGTSAVGLPLVALACALGAGMATIGAPYAGRRGNQEIASLLYRLALVCVVVAGICLVLWARDPQLWRWANKFPYPGSGISACFMCLAAADCLFHKPSVALASDEAARLDWRFRVSMSQLVALVFAVVLCVQSAAWFNLTNRLRETLAQSVWSCVSLAPVPWLQDTPLNQFAAPALSVIFQGRTPHSVALNGNGCTNPILDAGLNLNQFYTRSWTGGWFNFQPLRQTLIADQNVPRGCTFMLSTGWQDTETAGPYWWRWSGSRDARLRVLVDRATTVVLNGQVQSIRRPDAVRVLVNGIQRSSIIIPTRVLSSLQPLALSLRPGVNSIQFVGFNAPVLIGGRQLTFEAANFSMTTTYNNAECIFHP